VRWLLRYAEYVVAVTAVLVFGLAGKLGASLLLGTALLIAIPMGFMLLVQPRLNRMRGHRP
jgi:hypothetical protein